MHNLSMVQALGIWSELEDARQGLNGYGGDVAELYVYRFMPHDPLVARSAEVGAAGDLVQEAYDQANESMHNLLRHFAKKRRVRIDIEGPHGWTGVGGWLKAARYTHRVHVRVTQTGGRKKCICHGPDMIAGKCPVHDGEV